MAVIDTNALIIRSLVKLNWPYILAGLLVFYILWTLIAGFKKESSIRRLGGHAPKVPSLLPLGISLVRDNIKLAEEDDNLLFWDKLFKHAKWGSSTVELKTVGRRVILTADPENIKAVLATQFSDFGKGERFNEEWHEFLGDSIFSTDGHLWQNSRSLIRPQFVKDRVSDLHTFEKHVQILMSKLPAGQEVDMRELFFQYTLDAATDFLLGRSVDSLNGGGGEFAHAFGEIQRIQNKISRLGPLAWMMDRRPFRRYLKVLNDFVQPYIDDTLRLSQDELEKRSKSEEGYTFLHALAAYTRDRTILRDQLVAVLLAGRDTTACTLGWFFYELGRNPGIVAKLRDEIESVVGWTRAPTYADLKSMKYLQACLNETLRLYPVVPFNVRLALKDTTLPRGGGLDGLAPVGVLAGTPVAYSTHYMQLSQNIYPETDNQGKPFTDPLEFDPTRWFTWTPKSWTYVPFNGGPRICVGQNFALTEMGYTTVRILQRYRHLESRQVPIAPHPQLHSSTLPGASLVLKASARRELKMRSEIVLQPADKVRIAFIR